MKLLLVTGIFPPDRGGPASYVPKMAAALVERGHNVKVLCLSDSLQNDDSSFPFPICRIRRNIFWPCRVLLTTIKIWREALRCDLIYVNGLGSECSIAGRLAGVPAVHKIVGDYAWERAVSRGLFHGTIDDYQTTTQKVSLRALNWVRTFPLRSAKHVIVPSIYLKRIVAGWGISQEKLSLIYNAASPPGEGKDVFAKVAPWHGKTLITVCRFVPWKGIDGLIRMLPELPNTRLLVAGDGELRQSFLALAQECGVGERVVFLGDVPASAVRGYLQQADAFVLNSTYEGLPHVVLEAMSAGIPVIATDAGGTSEVLGNHITGLLVPVGDKGALIAAIKSLWRDRSLGPRLVAQAAAQLNGQFSFQKMVDSTESILRAASSCPEVACVALENVQ